MDEISGDWNKWGNHVVKELERLSASHYRLETKIDAVRARLLSSDLDIARLKVKVGLWGFLGGTLPALITLLGQKFLTSI